MKKLNNQGFTLIELVGVLVILTLLIMLVIPSISASIERNKEKQRQNKIEIIESAADIYFSDNRYKITKSFCCIPIGELVTAGLVTDSDMDDPVTNKKITGYIEYNAAGRKFLYKEHNCGISCFD